MLKKKSKAQFSEEIELELRERITFLEEQVRSLQMQIMAIGAVTKFLIVNEMGEEE